MRLRATAIVLFLGLFLPSMATAGDWKTIISKDRVQVVNGKMTMEEFSLCKVTVPNASKSSLQVRTYAEAPVSAGISRDFLVSYQARTKTFMLLSMGAMLAKGTSVDALKALDCDPIAAPIGKVDLEINLYLTPDGFQLAMVDGSSGKTTQESKRWEDVYASK